MSVSKGNEILKLEEACKTYRMGTQVVRALYNMTVSFKRGSFWAIMGPSGSGKSTMMNILGCLDKLTSGNFYLENQDMQRLTDDALSEFRLRYLGFIFQSFNLIPQFNVQRNIELPLYYLGWNAQKSARRAASLAEEVGLADRLYHRPAELSGGQMQRVAIARALANDPQIILADEPTGNLDTATGDQIMELLLKLHAQGKTIIMVTHESSVAEYAENKLHMIDGSIGSVEMGTDGIKPETRD